MVLMMGRSGGVPLVTAIAETVSRGGELADSDRGQDVRLTSRNVLQ